MVFSNSSDVRLGLAAVALLSWAVAVPVAMAGDFEDALAKAYLSNPSLEAARANLRATDEGVPTALSGFRPSVTASGAVGDSVKETSAAPGTKLKTDPTTMALTVSQPIFSGGASVAGVRKAKHQINAARARLHGTEQAILLSAATAYLNVVRDQAVRDLNINNEQVLTRQLQATRDRFRVGEITRTDVHLAEARLARAVADRISSESTLESSRASFANVVGEAPGAFSAPELTFNVPQSLEAALSNGEAANPSLIAAEFDEKAAREGVAVTRAALLPSVNLSGTARRSLDTVADGYWSTEYTGTLSLSVPLYQGGSVYSGLRGARHQAQALRLAFDQALRDATQQIRQTWQTHAATRARIAAFETQVQASQTALEGVQKEASVGSRTVLDVLDAEQELLDARVNLVSSQRDAAVAALSLLSSVGRLTAAELNLPVDLYDPVGHYQDVEWKLFGGAID